VKTITLKVSPETAKKLLADSEAELLKLRQRVLAKENEMAELRRAVEEIDAPVALKAKRNPTSNRVPKGQSEKIVLAFLQSHRGSGWTQTDISKHTGVSMPTAGRVLAKLTKAGEIDSSGNTWAAPV
jgi:response regulator of citrate/malate metabolism